MKITKKILALVMALMLVLSSVSVLADEVHTHDWDKAELIEVHDEHAKDCEKASYNVVKCSCGETKNVETIKAGAHNYNAWKTEPTCGTEGKQWEECARCHKVIEEKILPATGKHTPGQWEYEKNTTVSCKQDGVVTGVLRCANEKCRAVLDSKVDEKTAKLVHDFSGYFNTETGKAADGSKKDPAAGHVVVVEAREATCTKEGVYTIKCEICGEGATWTTKKKDHSYTVEKGSIASTCSQAGMKVWQCATCDDQITVTQTLAEHTTSTKFITASGEELTAAPACADSTEYKVCSVCGNKEYVAFHAAKKGAEHTDGLTVVTKKAECNVAGEKMIECSACKAIYTKPIKALDHMKDVEVKTVTPATCTTDGKGTKTCPNCKKTEEVVIKAYGHEYKEDPNKAVKGDCTKGTNNVKVEVCTVCKAEKKTETVAHVKGRQTDAVKATCKNEGSNTFLCTVCKNPFTEIVEKTKNHVPGAKVEVKETCLKDGSWSVKCTVCGDVLESGEGKKATGHQAPRTGAIEVHKNGVCSRSYNCTVCGAAVLNEAMDHVFAVSKKDDKTFVRKCTLCGASEQITAGEKPAMEIEKVSASNGSATLKIKGEAPTSKVYARVTWRYVLSSGEGMMVVNNFVFENGECEIVEPDVDATLDFCTVIITDTAKSHAKTPAACNKLAKVTVK